MNVKKILRKKSSIVTFIRGIAVSVIKCLCGLLGITIACLYKLLYFLQWKCPFTATPLFFDHDIELYQWKFRKVQTGEMQDWIDRGAFNRFFVMHFAEPIILELGCGNGFYARRFYSSATKVYACDIDHSGICEAKRRNKYHNIEFIECDFLKDMPCEQVGLTNVIWDASINFFTREQQKIILNNIKDRLCSKKGILSGSGIIKEEGKTIWEAYDSLFQSEEEIRELLEQSFSYVVIYRPKWEGSICYFAASDSEIIYTDHVGSRMGR